MQFPIVSKVTFGFDFNVANSDFKLDFLKFFLDQSTFGIKGFRAKGLCIFNGSLKHSYSRLTTRIEKTFVITEEYGKNTGNRNYILFPKYYISRQGQI